MSEFTSFVVALVVGFVLGIVGVVECGREDPKLTEACDYACAANGGTKATFHDGDCACANGAEIDWSHADALLSERNKSK